MGCCQRRLRTESVAFNSSRHQQDLGMHFLFIFMIKLALTNEVMTACARVTTLYSAAINAATSRVIILPYPFNFLYEYSFYPNGCCFGKWRPNYPIREFLRLKKTKISKR